MGRPGLHVRGPSPSRPSPSATATPFEVRGDRPKKRRMVPKLSGERLLRLMTIKLFPPPRPSVLFQYQSAHCSSIIQSVSLQCFSFSFLRPFSLSPLGGALFIFGVFFSLPPPPFYSGVPPWAPSAFHSLLKLVVLICIRLVFSSFHPTFTAVVPTNVRIK